MANDQRPNNDLTGRRGIDDSPRGITATDRQKFPAKRWADYSSDSSTGSGTGMQRSPSYSRQAHAPYYMAHEPHRAGFSSLPQLRETLILNQTADPEEIDALLEFIQYESDDFLSATPSDQDDRLARGLSTIREANRKAEVHAALGSNSREDDRQFAEISRLSNPRHANPTSPLPRRTYSSYRPRSTRLSTQDLSQDQGASTLNPFSLNGIDTEIDTDKERQLIQQRDSDLQTKNHFGPREQYILGNSDDTDSREEYTYDPLTCGLGRPEMAEILKMWSSGDSHTRKLIGRALERDPSSTVDTVKAVVGRLHSEIRTGIKYACISKGVTPDNSLGPLVLYCRPTTEPEANHMVMQYLELHRHSLQRRTESTFAVHSNYTSTAPTGHPYYSDGMQATPHGGHGDHGKMLSAKDQSFVHKATTLDKREQATTFLAGRLVKGKGNQMSMATMSRKGFVNLMGETLNTAKTGVFDTMNDPKSVVTQTYGEYLALNKGQGAASTVQLTGVPPDSSTSPGAPGRGQKLPSAEGGNAIMTSAAQAPDIWPEVLAEAGRLTPSYADYNVVGHWNSMDAHVSQLLADALQKALKAASEKSPAHSALSLVNSQVEELMRRQKYSTSREYPFDIIEPLSDHAVAVAHGATHKALMILNVLYPQIMETYSAQDMKISAGALKGLDEASRIGPKTKLTRFTEASLSVQTVTSKVAHQQNTLPTNLPIEGTHAYQTLRSFQYLRTALRGLGSERSDFAAARTLLLEPIDQALSVSVPATPSEDSSPDGADIPIDVVMILVIRHVNDMINKKMTVPSELLEFHSRVIEHNPHVLLSLTDIHKAAKQGESDKVLIDTDNSNSKSPQPKIMDEGAITGQTDMTIVQGQPVAMMSYRGEPGGQPKPKGGSGGKSDGSPSKPEATGPFSDKHTDSARSAARNKFKSMSPHNLMKEVVKALPSMPAKMKAVYKFSGDGKRVLATTTGSPMVNKQAYDDQKGKSTSLLLDPDVTPDLWYMLYKARSISGKNTYTKHAHLATESTTDDASITPTDWELDAEAFEAARTSHSAKITKHKANAATRKSRKAGKGGDRTGDTDGDTSTDQPDSSLSSNSSQAPQTPAERLELIKTCQAMALERNTEQYNAWVEAGSVGNPPEPISYVTLATGKFGPGGN